MIVKKSRNWILDDLKVIFSYEPKMFCMAKKIEYKSCFVREMECQKKA